MKILYECGDFLVIDKPYGMVVHPSDTGHNKGTVVHELKGLIGGGDPARPGIVHRLDKTTSGAMIVARTQLGYDYFVERFKKRAVKKIYVALVKGLPEHKEGIIDSPIGRSYKNRKKMGLMAEGSGKNAVTSYEVLKEFDGVSLIELNLKTGRTHQIRVHMTGIGHPVVGDDVYGVKSFNKRFFEKFGLDRVFLHAWKISFKDLNGKKLEFEVDLPRELKEVLTELKKL